MKKIRHLNGFTLTEMMFSLAVFSTCVALSVGAFVLTYKTVFFARTIDMAHLKVRNATDTIGFQVRQSIYYPMVYNSNVISTATLNVSNQAGQIDYVDTYGNELRIMPRGVLTSTATSLSSTSNVNQIVVKNNTGYSSVAAVPTATGTIGNNVVNISTEPVRNTASTYQIQPGDRVYIVASSIVPATVTNSIVSGDEITLEFAQPVNIPSSGSGTFTVCIGSESRFVVENEELRYYPNAASSDYKVLVDNVISTKPFRINGNMATTDITYSSPGDITGKGIYRIITRHTMRTDPTYGASTVFSSGGLNGVPEEGSF